MKSTEKRIYPSILLAMLMLFSSLPIFAEKQANIKRKSINQTYTVGQNDNIKVDNRFGNITVTYWNKKEVSLRIEIESKARDEQQAQATLDRIQIETRKEGNTVIAITSLNNLNKNNENNSFSINYFITMPSHLTAELSQKYGNINLPDKNEGKMDLEVKYGNLNAGDFTANLNIEAKYGNIDLGNLQNANIDLGYVGTANIKSGKELQIESGYSNLNIQHIQLLNMEMKYGNFKIESADKLNMEIKYSQATIGELKNSLNVSRLSYSNLKIKELSASFNSINVDSHYGNLEIGISSKASFKVRGENMKYSKCNVKGFNISKSTVDKDSHSHSYEINGGKSATINFNGNKYGTLTIKAN